jgi:mono/diheme cytochrome c family protein
MKTFFLPPGYRLELVAGEPLVRDPIVMDQDPDGRLYVIEMPAFAMDEKMQDSMEPICRVVVLEDTNNDGRMDKRTIFMDGLVLPRAVKVLADGVLIGEPPNLWLAKDTDGDGKADKKELIRGDFGRRDANLEHNANGLYWGMDNVIYTSEHTWDLRWKDGKFEMLPGLSRGQWNISQDDAGRIFRNWNEQPLFVDIIPARYFVRNPNVARTRGLYDVLIEREETAIWPVRPTPGLQRAYRKGMLREDGTATTYASSADPYIFRGDRLPKELQGNAFVADSPTNLVHRLIVDDDGSGRLKARDAYAKGEFLASTDERFRPVNLFSAADGTLYVIDMYRGVVQDIAYQTEYLNTYIKKNKLERPVGLGRIYRVVHDSMKPGPKPQLSKATPAQLADTLSHPNGWWRDTAQQLLIQRKAIAVSPKLTELVSTAPDWRTRLHALWTLDGLDAIEPATIEKALNDKAPAVRAGAVKISERWLRTPGHPIRAAVLQKTGDPNWSVRYQLAASLGELPREERLAPITAMLAKYGEDQIIVDAVISGLAGQESSALDRVVHADAVTLLAAAVARSRNEAAAQAIFQQAADANTIAGRREALLRGIDMGLSGGGRGLGGGRPGAPAGVGRLTLKAEPKALTAMDTDLARQIVARLDWPGKPAPPATGPKLTPAEEARVTAGEKIYANFCVGCHMANGQGNQGGSTNLAESKVVAGNPNVVMRIILGGKEGKVGLMPPLGAALNDDQAAAVISYIRRAWGRTASPVAPAEVQETRGVTSLKKTPWTEEELTRVPPPLRIGGR